MGKIAVYAIAKNEAKHVDRWYDSVKEADGIFVVDTGSTDNTMELLRDKENVTLYEANFQPFRFDLARNFILNQVPDEYDWCVFLDLDEVLEEGWCAKLEQEIEESPHATGFNVHFVYSRLPDGQPATTYSRHMVSRNGMYNWHYPVHELLQYIGPDECIIVSTDIVALHLPDDRKARDSYLPLLEMSVQENPNDPRAIQYLAREYMFVQQYQKALLFFHKHLTIEQSLPLRCETYRHMAQCNIGLGLNQEAERCFLRAIAECPTHREGWGDAANFYLRVQDYDSCLGMVSGMLRIHEFPTDSVIRVDKYYGSWPYHVGAVCYYNIGARELAVEFIKEAYRISPTDPYVIADLANIAKAVPANLFNQEQKNESESAVLS